MQHFKFKMQCVILKKNVFVVHNTYQPKTLLDCITFPLIVYLQPTYRMTKNGTWMTLNSERIVGGSL